MKAKAAGARRTVAEPCVLDVALEPARLALVGEALEAGRREVDGARVPRDDVVAACVR